MFVCDKFSKINNIKFIPYKNFKTSLIRFAKEIMTPRVY